MDNGIVARRSTGELEDLGVFAARWGEWAWRLSVVLHAAQHGNRAHQKALAPETAAHAIRIASWFTAQQLQLLEGIREQAWREHCDYIRKVLSKHPEGFTARTLKRCKVFGDADETMKILEGLVYRGYLTRKIPTGVRGHPAVTYVAGPKL